MIITSTPLRFSLFGGNTDFREYFLKYRGLVLTTTIDKYIYCIVKERFDNKIVVNYSIKEEVDNIDELQHELVRECLRVLNIKGGIEISFLGDIPSKGTGLGSSSAVTVGLLNALHNYLGESVSPDKLAMEAVHIEIDVLGKPIGIQDQYAVAYGGLRAFVFEPNGEVTTDRIKVTDLIREDLNNSLMLFYTGVTRSSNDVLSSFDVVKNKEYLDKTKNLANDGIVALLKGDLKRVGQLLDVSWDLKKKANSKVTNKDIDSMYSKVKRAGAIGAKVIGAGGGGFMLVMFPANKRAKIRRALKDYQEMPFRFSKFGSRVIINI
jgi:D-glycero-alpha-D-manno-heptose-7-phosphate kinase